MFHPNCADDEVSDRRRSVSVIEMDSGESSQKRQSEEANELDQGQDTQRQTVLPSDRTNAWRRNTNEQFKNLKLHGANCQ